MAVLTSDERYPCAFELNLSEWERYTKTKSSSDVKTVPLGEPYTLWVKYRMTMHLGEHGLYKSEKDTTLVLEDIKRLIDDLRQLVNGREKAVSFDPIEPDFGLVIRILTKSDASVMISSAAEIRGEMPTGATNQSTDPLSLFDVNVWIDYPNQVDCFYGGYGPGLYFFVESQNIERFADQLQIELDALGPYFSE